MPARTGPTSRPRAGQDLVDVELVEVGHQADPGPAVVGGGPGGPPPVDRRRAAHRRPAVAGLALAVVAGVLVVNVLETRAERAGLARLAGQVGVLDSLAEPLTVRWERPGWLGVEVDGIGLVPVDSGSQEAVDLVTGEVLWTRPDASEVCWPVGSDDARRLGCLDQAAFFGRAGAGGPVALEVLEPRTGTPVSSLAVDGTYVGSDTVGGDVVLATALGDGRLRLVRWRPSSGEVVWDTVSREPAFAGSPPDLRSWSVAGDVLVVGTAAGEVAVSVGSGEQLPVPPAPLGEAVRTVDLAGGATATWAYADDGSGSGAVHEADGTLRFHLPGPVLEPAIDDGTAADLLVVTDQEGESLRAIDAATGEDRWSTSWRGGHAMLVRDGRMLLGTATGLASIDLRDGSEVWSTGGADASEPWQQSIRWQESITDGQVVLTLESGDGPPALVARRLTDGSEVWRTVVPPTTQGVTAVGAEGVLLSTDRGLVGYG